MSSTIIILWLAGIVDKIIPLWVYLRLVTDLNHLFGLEVRGIAWIYDRVLFVLDCVLHIRLDVDRLMMFLMILINFKSAHFILIDIVLIIQILRVLSLKGGRLVYLQTLTLSILTQSFVFNLTDQVIFQLWIWDHRYWFVVGLEYLAVRGSPIVILTWLSILNLVLLAL